MKNKRRECKRAAAMLLAALMVVNSVDLSAFTAYAAQAELVPEKTEQSASSKECVMTITDFEELEEDVMQQLLPVGASEEEIIFPDTLNVTVSAFVPMTVYAAEEQATNDGEEAAQTKNITLTGVTWKIEPSESDGEVFDSCEGCDGYCYVYTPVLPETDEDGNKVTLGDNVETPVIYVLIGEGEDHVSAIAEDGYTEEGFCKGYDWVDGELKANTGEGATTCSHGDDCNGYQPAVQITAANASTYFTMETDKTKYKDYYAITNAGQLYWFAAHVNGWKSGNSNDTRNSNAVLLNNITVNSGLLNDNGELNTDAAVRNWTPIGLNNNDGVYFYGTFDGQNKTISGIYCSMPDREKGVGLFGYLYNKGTISNVTLADSYITGKQSVGGICGKYSGGTITNCTNNATVVATAEYSYAGGIFGNCQSVESGMISNCTNNGKISGGAYVGGICDSTWSGMTMQNCTNTGSVTGTGSKVGGICGSNGGSLKGSTNSGSIEGLEYVGGICGENQEKATVEECDNNGNVTETQTERVTDIRIGGICGSNSGTVKKCENQTGGAVSVSSKLYSVGGICGVNYKTLEECTNQATITGCREVGGICGSNEDSTNSVITNCTNEGTVTVYQTEDKSVTFVHIGGVCGENKGTVTGSSHKGTVSAEKAEHVGGICGINTGTVTESKNESGTVKGYRMVGGICGTSGKTIGECTNSGGVTGVNGYVGGICGSNTDAATITDSTNEAAGTINGKEMVGGICGDNGSSAKESIKKCENKGGVTGDDQVGGICGTHTGSGAIVSCKNVNAEVKGATQVGGICGEVGASGADISIKDCESSGSIIGTDAKGYVGGICGVSERGIADSHNSATVQGKYYAGGICGKLNGQSIDNCTNQGTVTGTSAGGVCGWQCGTINNSTNQAKVTGTTYAGGICSENSGTVQNSKNTGAVSGDSDVGGICGKNLAGNGTTEIKNCINSASVEGKRCVGGICGYHEGKLVSGCCNSGTVTGNGSGGCEVGGICGYSYQFKIMDSCNTGTVSGTNSVGGIVGAAGEVRNAYNAGKVIMTGESRNIGVIYGTGNTEKMSNCYYLDTVKIESDQKDKIHAYWQEATAMTREQFSSGKVAWLLNGSKSDSPTWYQWIDAEDKTQETYPVLVINRSSDSTGSGEGSGGTTDNYGIVYQCKPCTVVYSNTENKKAEHGKGEALPSTEEDAATMHKCSLCGEKITHSDVVYKADENSKDTIFASCSCEYSYGSIVLKAPVEGEAGLIYDGNEKAATVDTATNLTLPTGVTISATDTDVTYSKIVNGTETALTGGAKPKDVGEYRANLTLKGNDNAAVTACVTYKITAATPTVEWSEPNQTVYYTTKTISSDKLPALTVKGVNDTDIKESYDADDITYFYRKSDGASSTGAFTTGLPTVCGTYEIKATVKAKGNYTGAETTEDNYLTLTIDWLNITETATLKDQKGNSLTGNDWAKSVTFTAPDGYTISWDADEKDAYGSCISFSNHEKDTDSDGILYTYYLKKTATGEIAKKTQTVRIDRTAPTFPENGGITIW